MGPQWVPVEPGWGSVWVWVCRHHQMTQIRIERKANTDTGFRYKIVTAIPHLHGHSALPGKVSRLTRFQAPWHCDAGQEIIWSTHRLKQCSIDLDVAKIVPTSHCVSELIHACVLHIGLRSSSSPNSKLGEGRFVRKSSVFQSLLQPFHLTPFPSWSLHMNKTEFCTLIWSRSVLI